MMKTVEDLFAPDPARCCGCGACAAVCPANCLEMRPDAEGFLYPVIDHNRCVSCGACLRVCPVLNAPTGAAEDPQAFAFVSDNEPERLRSSSGGCFQQIAQAVLDQKGTVYGAGFDEDWNVVHKRAENSVDVHGQMTSKYVQSRMGDIYLRLRADLEAGRTVLFSGTPCQCAGIKKLVGDKYGHQLIIADLICHGVPSPRVWRMYLDLFSKGRTVTDVSFRDKNLKNKTPWELFGLKISFSDGSYYQESLKKDAYMRAFLSNLILRPSCAQCRFRQIKRPVDFTLADFWGVKNVMPSAYDKNGTSLVLLHTQRARVLFSKLSGLKMSASLDAVLKSNSAITRDVKSSPYRAEFFARLNSDDLPIDELLDSFTYRDSSAFRRFRRRLAHALGRTKQIRRA